MKIRVGSKVKIKDINDIDNNLEDIVFLERSMGGYCNEIAIITGTYDNEDTNQFKLDIDNGEYVWDIRWLEKAIPNVKLPDKLFEL